jgi:hypothetical protein
MASKEIRERLLPVPRLQYGLVRPKRRRTWPYRAWTASSRRRPLQDLQSRHPLRPNGPSHRDGPRTHASNWRGGRLAVVHLRAVESPLSG